MSEKSQIDYSPYIICPDCHCDSPINFCEPHDSSYTCPECNCHWDKTGHEAIYPEYVERPDFPEYLNFK